MTQVPALSVIVPFFNEEDSIGRMHAAIVAAVEPLGVPFEMVFVDDGSRDGTATLLREATGTWPQLRLVRLLRNSGHQAALSAGFRRARGDYLVTIDADLQDPPEAISELLATAREKDVDVVGAPGRVVRRSGRPDDVSA